MAIWLMVMPWAATSVGCGAPVLLEAASPLVTALGPSPLVAAGLPAPPAPVAPPAPLLLLTTRSSTPVSELHAARGTAPVRSNAVAKSIRRFDIVFTLRGMGATISISTLGIHVAACPGAHSTP